VKIGGRLIRGFFEERPNRFLAFVKVKGRILPSFLPNPGRMQELLTPRTEVILREVLKQDRKTDYDLIGVLFNGEILSIDSRIPNKLVLEALKNGDIQELSEYNIIKPEYSYRHTRFDFLLAKENQRCLLEVKSCTLVKDGVAMFPDAQTERGSRYVRDLLNAKKEGYRACILFLVQRGGANVFTPNDETDPKFGKVLRSAVMEGLEVYAYRSEFIENKITLVGKVTVELESDN